jgi:hypothetical protein
MSKREDLEERNYRQLVEWAARWHFPHGVLDRIRRFAREAARRGRTVEHMRSTTLPKIFDGPRPAA